MNRLILVGNGFDLAHKMKTSYNDFILWYLKQALDEALDRKVYNDDLIQITRTIYYDSGRIQMGSKINSVETYIDYFYSSNINVMLTSERFKIDNSLNDYFNPFEFKFKAPIFQEIVSTCSFSNWVEIENVFYKHLKVFVSKPERGIFNINTMNVQFSYLINKLEEYLLTVNVSHYNKRLEDILMSIINYKTIKFPINNPTAYPIQNLILNFNYTNTPELYREKLQTNLTKTTINYIHGKLKSEKNPIIFGFGDELDENYLTIEKLNDNKFFKFIKSFGYFKSSNYHSLLSFVDSGEFEVFVLGHSCGLSDRTMLNMIFENKNCVSIRIFYHETSTGNNYINLTQEISRHFKDKAMLRKKIVPFDECQPMPQLTS